jgi:phosphate transport system protein
MLQRSLDSLARMDIDAARQVIGADKAIDAAFNAILRQLITYMMEDPRTISEAEPAMISPASASKSPATPASIARRCGVSTRWFP